MTVQANTIESADALPAAHPVALLDVTRAGGWMVQHQLDIESMLLVGSSDQCGLALTGDDVAAMHCSLRRDATGIWLSDWDSPGGTLLDGARVTAETQVQPGSRIQVGAYTIQLRCPSFAQHRNTDSTDGISTNASDQPAQTGPLATQPSPITGNTSPAERRHVQDAVAAFASRESPPGLGQMSAGDAGNVTHDASSECPHEDHETYAMLRAEVEQLQYELAERDAQLAELRELPDGANAQSEESSNDQLMGRIDQLLDELDCSDQRATALEELLEAAEEAHRSEREERRQLESWITDIEALVSEHDKNRSAEVESLKEHIATLVTERNELMQHLSRPAKESNSDQVDMGQVDGLRIQITQLSQQLNDANAAAARSQDELRLRNTQLAEAVEAKQELREEHLKLAEERAALARLRAELKAQHAESQTRPPDARTDIDNRVRVFREHLREIHEQERQQQSEQSLSTRISRLWRRIEEA